MRNHGGGFNGSIRPEADLAGMQLVIVEIKIDEIMRMLVGNFRRKDNE
jgi:hypothetical protein